MFSLHDWRFMNQAGRTRYFARSATRARSARRGEEKNKAPIRSPLFLLFRPPTPTNINYPRWCQKNQSKHAKIVTFLARSVCIAVDMASRTPTKVYGPKSFHSLCRTVLNSNNLFNCHIQLKHQTEFDMKMSFFYLHKLETLTMRNVVFLTV